MVQKSVAPHCEIGRTNEQNKRKYLTAFKSLMQAYSSKGELEAALAVKAELDKLAGKPATDSVLPAGVLPLETSLTKGLALFEFDPLDSQQDDSNIGVHYSKFGVPLGKPKRVSEIDGLTYDREHNAVATGYLRIEKSGEYGFSTYNFYDRNALYVKDLEKPLCGYRDHREKHTIELPAGYVPLVAVSYIKTRGSFETVIWKPPGAEDYEPIPAKLLYFDRERAATSIGVPEK